MTVKKLRLSEMIDRAKEKEGRTQKWIISQMQKRGIVISDVLFSRKKKGVMSFTEEELKALSEILDSNIGG
jgi:hypothetical protein